MPETFNVDPRLSRQASKKFKASQPSSPPQLQISTTAQSTLGKLFVVSKSRIHRSIIQTSFSSYHNGYPIEAKVYLPLLPARAPLATIILNLAFASTITHPNYNCIRSQHPHRTSRAISTIRQGTTNVCDFAGEVQPRNEHG